MTSKLVVNTIEADTGISSVSFASSISMSSTSKFHFGNAGIDIGADTNINRPSAGVLGFNINGGEKVRIQSNGRVGISTDNPVSALHVLGTTHALGNGGASLIWGDSVYLGALTFDGSADNQPVIRSASSKDLIFQVNQSTEALRIKSGGQVGINANTPSAGDMASGASFAAPKLHVGGDGSQSGAYELLARFQSGTDADNTGATIVLNHANDRGLAIQGGRRTGNYAHGALKMVDNVGRLSDAMLIHGGAGQGVDHINFYTGISTVTDTRLHIDNAGRVLIGTTNNSNGHIAASKAAVHGHLAIFKDSEGDNAGVNSHQIKFVTQSGSIAEIMATSSGAGGPSGRGGYLSLFAKPNNNATLSERVRVTDTGTAFMRVNTTNEGGEISFTRASDDTNYFYVDTYGSGSSPRFRVHGGTVGELASVTHDGKWYQAPEGTVIKLGYQRYDPNQDSYSVIGQDTLARSAAYLDYTCQRTDSLLVILTRMHTRMINATGASYGIQYSTNSGSSWTSLDGMAQRNAMDFFYKGDSVNHHYTGFCLTTIGAYSGTRRFSPWAQGWGGGTWEVSYGHGEHSITIFEVQT